MPAIGSNRAGRATHPPRCPYSTIGNKTQASPTPCLGLLQCIWAARLDACARRESLREFQTLLLFISEGAPSVGPPTGWTASVGPLVGWTSLVGPRRLDRVVQSSRFVLLTTGTAVAEQIVNIIFCFRFANYWN